MLIQPYIENAVIHGLARKEGKGEVHISFRKMEKQLQVVVRDNGIGREAAGKSQSERRSVGMLITRQRLELLNGEMAMGARHAVEVRDLTDEAGNAAGTEVEVLIPFRLD